jgi:hypothetical protein
MMRRGLLGTLLALLAGAGLVSAGDPGYAPDPALPLPWSFERVLPYQTWCGYPHTFWLSAEFQSVWMKDGNLPPLVTRGPAGSQGILGQPGTILLYGDEEVNYNPFLGGKFMGGVWGDYNELFGLEGGFMFAAEKDDKFVAYTPGGPNAPVIARPVISALTGQQTSSLALIPGIQVGTIDVLSTSRFLGAEGHLIFNWHCLQNGRIDCLVGIRYLELDEYLEIDEAGVIDDGPSPSDGFQAVISDEFDARTRFYGGYLGAKGQFYYDGWTLDLVGRVSIGATQEAVDITGITGFVSPTNISTYGEGGLLALFTNAGPRQKDVFGVVPEVGVRAGYQVLERLKVYAGINALYWNKVIRVGDQVDLTINPTQLPTSATPFQGPLQPTVLFRDTDFWLVAVSAGLEVRY